MQPLKPGDAVAFWRLFSFLTKCETMGIGFKHNALDTPEMTCIIFAKQPLYLEGRWNRNTLLVNDSLSRSERR